MDLYLVVNIALLFVGPLTLVVGTLWIRGWHNRQRQEIQFHIRQVPYAFGPGGDWERAMPLDEILRRMQFLIWFVPLLNIATTVLALIPLGFAIYNLVINNQRQALIFNLLSLALVFVAKGVLFVLTVFITGAIGGAGTVVGTRAMKKAWDRWDAQREQPPTR